MPYITPDRRTKYDKELSQLVWLLQGDPFDGDLAYVLYRLVLGVRQGPNYMGFHGIARILGILESVKAEVLRQVVEPYEDQRIADNGRIS